MRRLLKFLHTLGAAGMTGAVAAVALVLLTAIHTWLFTAFSDVPKNRLIRRCCLIHLKKSSTDHRLLYNAQTLRAGMPK